MKGVKDGSKRLYKITIYHNPETYAIVKADMLIKGGNASGMKYGDNF